MIEIRRAIDLGRHVEPSLTVDNSVVSSEGTADATCKRQKSKALLNVFKAPGAHFPTVRKSV